MDTIAHGLTGALVGYCGFRQRGGRAALVGSILGAEFPDIDIVLALIDGETYLRWHRGITHSILLLPLWSALVAFLVWEMSGRKNMRTLWAASAAGMVSHLLLDWITSYGTMLLSPLSNVRFELSWVFILDPYVWAMLGVSLWLVIRTQSEKAGKTCLAVFAGYILMCGAFHGYAIWRERNNENASAIAAYPQPMNPFRFTVVAENGNTLHWSSGDETKNYVQYKDTELLPKAEATESVKLYRWFAESLLVERLEENGRTVLRYRDLRFRSPLLWGGVREGMFVVAKVFFDDHGNVLASVLTSDE